jgi:hypothetical protein
VKICKSENGKIITNSKNFSLLFSEKTLYYPDLKPDIIVQKNYGQVEI